MRLIVEHGFGHPDQPPHLIGIIELTPEGLHVDPRASAAECRPDEPDPDEAEDLARTPEQIRASVLYRRRQYLNRILRHGREAAKAGQNDGSDAGVLRWLAERQPDQFDLRLEDDEPPVLPAAHQAP